MHRPILLAALLLVWCGLASAQGGPQAADQPGPEGRRRVALVVGIGSYEHAGQRATVRDARLMARRLLTSGFTLVGGGPVLDVDKRGFDAAIREFGRMAEGADMAFFYFSGHGLQHDGRNWLMARDNGPPARAAEPEPGSIELGAVLRQLEAAQARLTVLVLDACRGERSRSRVARDAAGAGLAAMRAPRGTVIAFAARPGHAVREGGPGRGSVYTPALVQAMGLPGLGLMQMFDEAALRAIDLSGGRQEPWLAISPLRGDFAFTGRDEPAAVARPVAPLVTQNPDFTLVNFAGQPVRELRASLANEGLGEERLAGNLFQAGERYRLTFPRDHGCHVDVRATFSPGTEPSEVRNLDTCEVDMLLLTPQGRLIPANPDVLLVNETGRPIRRIQAALTSEGDWGPDRLSGEAMAPEGTLELHLPQGVTCDVDIRATFEDGTSREWRRQDTCAVVEYPLR